MMTSESFTLHQRLAGDSEEVGELPLCRVLLMNDARFPWLVLVPRVVGAREIHHLAEPVRLALWQESAWLGATMEQVYRPDKLNIAALGNIVEQLHVHHVARFRGDAAWPGAVWGQGSPIPYAETQLQDEVLAWRVRLASYPKVNGCELRGGSDSV